jgi:SagB-type dehydrogenase family enzyme
MDTWFGTRRMRRPRLRRGLAVLTAGEAILLDGGPSRQMFSGTAALSLLPRLLPALDGQRSRAELCAELALSGAQLDSAIRLLDGSGLLEWALPGNALSSSDHVAQYLSRTLAISESCRSSDDLISNLADCAVLLVGPSCFAEPVAEDLSETGVGMVKIMTAPEAASALPAMTGRCVAAVFDDPADSGVLDLMAAECRRHDFPVLRFHGAGDYAEVGPAFCGLNTACIECFRRSDPAAWRKDQPTRDEHAATGHRSAALTGVLASLVTSAVLSILTSQPPVAPLKNLTRVVMSSRTTEAFDVVPDLECAYCAGGTPPADAVSRDLLLYEWRSAQVTPALTPADDMTPARRKRIAALARERAIFPASPRHPLPDQATASETSTKQGSRGIDESVLARIMARVAGFRPAEAGQPPSPDRRWAPSGGNLASVALYLITDRDLFGLPGTIFRYDDLEHQVVSVHADRVSVDRALAGTDLDPASADAVIVLAGEVGRLGEKYGDFAWRLTHLDTGCAALQLQLVAGDCGVRTTFAATWPEQVAELLELDRRQEVITAIAALAVAPTRERTSLKCR